MLADQLAPRGAEPELLSAFFGARALVEVEPELDADLLAFVDPAGLVNSFSDEFSPFDLKLAELAVPTSSSTAGSVEGPSSLEASSAAYAPLTAQQQTMLAMQRSGLLASSELPGMLLSAHASPISSVDTTTHSMPCRISLDAVALSPVAAPVASPPAAADAKAATASAAKVPRATRGATHRRTGSGGSSVVGTVALTPAAAPAIATPTASGSAKRKAPDVDWRSIADVEERRRQRRLAKNRVTAARSRERKKVRTAAAVLSYIHNCPLCRLMPVAPQPVLASTGRDNCIHPCPAILCNFRRPSPLRPRPPARRSPGARWRSGSRGWRTTTATCTPCWRSWPLRTSP